MNIKDMLPEQLNAFVAEKVMGWHPKECESNLLEGDGYWRCSTCGLEGDWRDDFNRYSGHIGLPPRYSESIEAAWAIVEKMLARQEQEHYFKHFEWDGPRYKPSYHYLTQEGYPLNTVGWYVSLSVNDYRQFVCADTAPRAICYAALIAVGASDRNGTVKEEV